MSMNRRTFVAAVLAGVASARLGFAADKDKKEDLGHKEGEWDKLGEVTAAKKEERDVIEVKNAKDGGAKYTALSFRVEKGDVDVEDVKVTFDNDKTFSPETKLSFREKERSGKIDLPGDARAIKRIRFLYRSIGRGQAVIAVYGKVAKAEKK